MRLRGLDVCGGMKVVERIWWICIPGPLPTQTTSLWVKGVFFENFLMWIVIWWETPLFGYQSGSMGVEEVLSKEGSLSSDTEGRNWDEFALTVKEESWSYLWQQSREVCHALPLIWHWGLYDYVEVEEELQDWWFITFGPKKCVDLLFG